MCHCIKSMFRVLGVYNFAQGVTPGALDQFLGVGEASKKDPDQGIQKSIKDN